MRDKKHGTTMISVRLDFENVQDLLYSEFTTLFIR